MSYYDDDEEFKDPEILQNRIDMCNHVNQYLENEAIEKGRGKSSTMFVLDDHPNVLAGMGDQ